MREPPVGFLVELQARFGSDWSVRFNDAVGRWEFTSLSASGQPVSQFWGWFTDPKTGEPIAPDPVTGLNPFRDLDTDAQAEIFRNLARSYIGKTGYGEKDWSLDQAARRAHNTALKVKSRKARATLFADMIAAMDIRRPWVKHHAGNAISRGVAQRGR